MVVDASSLADEPGVLEFVVGFFELDETRGAIANAPLVGVDYLHSAFQVGMVRRLNDLFQSRIDPDGARRNQVYRDAYQIFSKMLTEQLTGVPYSGGDKNEHS